MSMQPIILEIAFALHRRRGLRRFASPQRAEKAGRLEPRFALFHLGLFAWIGIALVAALLLYEHSIISPRDLRRMNAAFFTLNGVISIIFFVSIAADILHRR